MKMKFIPYQRRNRSQRPCSPNAIGVILETLDMHIEAMVAGSGVGRTTLENYKHGRNSPTTDKAIKIADYLERDLGIILSLDHIYCRKDVKPILAKYLRKNNGGGL